MGYLWGLIKKGKKAQEAEAWDCRSWGLERQFSLEMTGALLGWSTQPALGGWSWVLGIQGRGTEQDRDQGLGDDPRDVT